MRRIGAGNNPMVGMTVAVENLKTDTSFKALPVMCLTFSCKSGKKKGKRRQTASNKGRYSVYLFTALPVFEIW